MKYLNFSYTEVMCLPIWQRQWFVERLIEENKKTSDAQEDANRQESKGMKHKK